VLLLLLARSAARHGERTCGGARRCWGDARREELAGNHGNGRDQRAPERDVVQRVLRFVGQQSEVRGVRARASGADSVGEGVEGVS